MKSRYGVLRTLGTLSIIWAVILLLLGIASGALGWWGLGQLLPAIDLPREVSSAANAVAFLVPLIWGLVGFLQFFVIGKVLHLLVGLDDAAVRMSAELERQSSNQQALVSAVLTGPAASAPSIAETS